MTSEASMPEGQPATEFVLYLADRNLVAKAVGRASQFPWGA